MYKRTALAIEHLNLTLGNLLLEHDNRKVFENDFFDLLSNSSLNPLDFERVNEIFEIEKLRLSLTKSNKVSPSDFFYQIERYKRREMVLVKGPENYFENRFQLNPGMSIRESYWNWNEELCKKDSPHLKGIFKSDKGEHYYALKQIITYNYGGSYRVIEQYINEYQFFILSLFEGKMKLKSILSEFENQFQVNSGEEKEQLREMSVDLFKELIFYNFIELVID